MRRIGLTAMVCFLGVACGVRGIAQTTAEVTGLTATSFSYSGEDGVKASFEEQPR
jgi:hypothetical protein